MIPLTTSLMLCMFNASDEKLVVLSFDDAVKSHLTYVAPLLAECGFGATFFISAAWMEDQEHFLSWEDVGELHRMGFEIGNHTWTHANFNTPDSAVRLGDEIDRIEQELRKVGVPPCVSFGWPGNGFGPEALTVVQEKGFKFARRGMQPEKPYGEICFGPLYDPQKHHPLLIPTSADAYPQWDLGHFKKVVNQALPGKALVLQFHGVPDIAHPWVHTPPERFKEYMLYLKENHFRVIALRDLPRYLDIPTTVEDPMLDVRYP